jgi:hypothetical protein
VVHDHKAGSDTVFIRQNCGGGTLAEMLRLGLLVGEAREDATRELRKRR